MTLSGALVKSTIVAALGGLLFGFDTAVIAGTTAALTHAFVVLFFYPETKNISLEDMRKSFETA